MRNLYLVLSFVIPLFCFSNGGTLMGSNFYRLNQFDFRVSSHFFAGTSSCYPIQYRFEEVRNDTLFLAIIFETRGPADALGCGRSDTLQATLQTSYNYINVSSGAITFNQTDSNLADTIWNVSDSTFNAQLGIPEFGSSSDLSWNISNNELKVISDITLQSVELVDLNGKTMLYTKEDQFDISFLESGVYLMRVLTGAGVYKTIRWFRP